MRIVLARAAWMTGLGLLAGSVLTWASTRLLAGLLFGLQPRDPTTFGAGMALLSVAALVASLLPALRAAKVDPLVAIRDE